MVEKTLRHRWPTTILAKTLVIRAFSPSNLDWIWLQFTALLSVVCIVFSLAARPRRRGARLSSQDVSTPNLDPSRLSVKNSTYERRLWRERNTDASSQIVIELSL